MSGWHPSGSPQGWRSTMVPDPKRKRPNYPGRDTVVAPVVTKVAGKYIREYADVQVLRLVGYHTVWHALRSAGVVKPQAAIVARGIVNRSTAWKCERDFERVFGVPLDQCTHAQVLDALAASGRFFDPGELGQ